MGYGFGVLLYWASVLVLAPLGVLGGSVSFSCLAFLVLRRVLSLSGRPPVPPMAGLPSRCLDQVLVPGFRFQPVLSVLYLHCLGYYEFPLLPSVVTVHHLPGGSRPGTGGRLALLRLPPVDRSLGYSYHYLGTLG